MAANWMNDIYTKTCTALAGLTGASTINYFEVQMNQEKKEGQELARNYPAVFFKYHNVLWIETGSTTTAQLGIVEMELEVIHEMTDDYQLLSFQPTGRSDITRRNTDLQNIFNAMQNLSGSTFNPMRRMTMSEDFDNENLRAINKSKFYTNVMSDGSTPPFLLSIDYGQIARQDALWKANKCCK